jgi:transaldolase
MTTTLTSLVPAHDSKLASAVREFCRKQHKPQKKTFASNPTWAAVKKTGTELWLDTGDIDEANKLWCSEFTALTTNNTLLNKEIQKGIYDGAIPQVAELLRKENPRIDDRLLVLEIAFALNALHGLKLVETFDAFVSVELHTATAHDVQSAVNYGKRFWAICPERFIVKVPLTPAGLLAARQLSDAGVTLNFTLGFSARQNYVIALTSRPSFVNVFMGRLNAFAADHKLNDGAMVGEKATQASQAGILALRQGKEQLKTRQIGASMRSGGQVADLVGLDVFTMPTKAAKEFLDQKPDPKSIRSRIQEGRKVTWNAGVDAKADKLDVLWEQSETLGKAMCKLYAEDLQRMTAGDLAAFFRSNGVGDLFPDFTEAERARIGKEGKIPSYTSWKDEVRKGRMAWDALCTEAGLLSFTQDQDALDDRIRKVLAGKK